ncbi:PrsW family intramembrane metalloprotease [candidate division KSB1 bacterium]|nr:PrsW family intramembrane metalloprotease [candidate division KSB1 bacterium]
MIEILRYSFGLVPVFLFLATLLFLDSYKLIRLRLVLQNLGMGSLIAVFCFLLNTALIGLLHYDLSFYSRFIAPVLEEIFKALFIIFLIRTHRIGFLIDAAIAGFAVGAGFAFIENIYYLSIMPDANLLLWLLRGFGTAMMHGGTTAIFAMVSKNFYDRYAGKTIFVFLPGLLVAIFIHSIFNHFFLPPLLMTLLQLIILPLLIMLIFSRSEKMIQEWLELGLDTDVTLMECINSGTMSETKIGQYLSSLKDKFTSEVVADMFCLLRLQLELSIRAKGILLMRNAGFQAEPDIEVKEKFAELKFLEKSIGKTGKLALMPILRTTTRDLWQFYFLQ